VTRPAGCVCPLRGGEEDPRCPVHGAPLEGDRADVEAAGRVCSWCDLRVTHETFRILTDPVNAARIAVRVGRGAYATAGGC